MVHEKAQVRHEVHVIPKYLREVLVSTVKPRWLVRIYECYMLLTELRTVVVRQCPANIMQETVTQRLLTVLSKCCRVQIVGNDTKKTDGVRWVSTEIYIPIAMSASRRILKQPITLFTETEIGQARWEGWCPALRCYQLFIITRWLTHFNFMVLSLWAALCNNDNTVAASGLEWNLLKVGAIHNKWLNESRKTQMDTFLYNKTN